MRTLNYFPCKVCTRDGDDVMVPVAEVDPKTYEILAISCEKTSDVTDEQKKDMGFQDDEQFEHCEATILENTQVMCYKCEKHLYFDATTKTCKSRKHTKSLEGCTLSYDNAHCTFCDEGYQMDASIASCISSDKKLDLSRFQTQENMNGSTADNEMSANSNTVNRDNNLFDASNRWSDESGANGFDESDYDQGGENNMMRYV